MIRVVFHVGYHKTATSWLQKSFFEKHLEVNLLSNWRKPWNDDFLRYIIGSPPQRFDKDVCKYILNERIKNDGGIGVGIVSAERLSGHPYSGGYDNFMIAERISSCFFDAKIIISVRNQVSMLKSMYQQLVREGYLGKYADFVKGQRWKGTSFCMEYLEYDALIKKYFDLFGKENVKVLVFEDLKENLDEYTKSICDFLDVMPMSFLDSINRVNTSPPVNHIKALRVMNHFRESELNPFPLFKISGKGQTAGRKILRTLLLGSKKPLVSDEDIEKTKLHYQDSNVRLSNLLGRDMYVL